MAKYKSMLRMNLRNLQLFAEGAEPQGESGTPESEVPAGPTPEPEKMVSVAEMQRRLEQAEKKHAQSTQEAISKALEQYKAENELSGKENIADKWPKLKSKNCLIKSQVLRKNRLSEN